MSSIINSALVLILPIGGAVALIEVVVAGLGNAACSRYTPSKRRSIRKRNALITLAVITGLGMIAGIIAIWESLAEPKTFAYQPSVPTFIVITLLCLALSAWAIWRLGTPGSAPTRVTPRRHQYVPPRPAGNTAGGPDRINARSHHITLSKSHKILYTH